MEQKHYIDIERISFGDEIKSANTDGFHPNDIIQISEKIDGANASVRYDAEKDILQAFSRKKLLDEENDLRGFYQYAQTLDATLFKQHPSWVVFGEWLVPHSVKYDKEYYNHWYVYDIYDTDTKMWLLQSAVKCFCAMADLTYILNVIYEGRFTSWDEIIKYSKTNSTYGAAKMEGIVIKNQTELNNSNSKTPFVLKYVNDSFAEVKHNNHVKKRTDTNKKQEIAKAEAATKNIVTKQRVQKEIFKMQDENILPKQLTPQDMKMIAQVLPEKIYKDCLKEEQEFVEKIGAFFKQCCYKITMNYAKEIIL